MTKLLEAAAVLLVADVVASSSFFRDQLGFNQIDLHNDPPDFAIVGRDQVRIMLAQKPAGAAHLPNWRVAPKTNNLYIWVDDVDTLYADVQRRGAHIDFTLYTTPWGTREFGVQDPDEHDITFGQVLA